MNQRRDSSAETASSDSAPTLLGVISDTHGRLRPEVFDVFRQVEHVLHAGDVGDPAILEELSALAPVTAVWGNMDGQDVRVTTREAEELEIAGTPIAVIHGHQLADHSKLPERFPKARIIVHGHTHLPANRHLKRTLLLNPGSAGPRREGKPVTVALLELGGGMMRARHIHLTA